MSKQILLLITLISVLGLMSCGDGHKYAEIETEYGNITIKLFNSTPKHRDNFVKLVKEGFYDDLLFHRIIKGFMIQGGDPESRDAEPKAYLGGGGPGYTLPAEIGAPHFRGSVAAARLSDQVNPKKESSGSQFFIVQGSKQTDQFLDQMESMKGFKYNDTQRKLYKEKGGYPSLDGEYTVFAEVVTGLEIIDTIANMEKDQANRPLKDVKMKIKMVKAKP